MVRVDAPARLHLGQIDLNGSLGRVYGGLGGALDGNRLVLRVERGDVLAAEGPGKERLEQVARQFMDRVGLKEGVRLTLEETIPSHVGLGSGTQMDLAVALGISQLFGLNYEVADLVTLCSRGRQSGVGINLFQRGGFVVDGGIPRQFNLNRSIHDGYVPPLLFSHPFPPDWTFVVVTPSEIRGFSGRQEAMAFSALPPIPPEDVGLVCRLLVMQLLPALMEKDLEAFGQAITEIQWIIGNQFAAVQGGLYSHPLAEKIVRFLLNAGAVGAGQSSWGPTLYALVEGRSRADSIAAKLEEYLQKKQISAEVRVQGARNHGARVLTESGVL